MRLAQRKMLFWQTSTAKMRILSNAVRHVSNFISIRLIQSKQTNTHIRLHRTDKQKGTRSLVYAPVKSSISAFRDFTLHRFVCFSISRNSALASITSSHIESRNE